MAHGDIEYFIDGEEQGNTGPIPAAAPAPPDIVPTANRRFIFGRIFPKEPQQDIEPLIKLGEAMEESDEFSGDHPDLPAGFTYLGQFVDHDITRDPTKGFPEVELEPDTIENGRTPSLDLDSLYQLGPELSPLLFEDDGVMLKVGATAPSSHVDDPSENFPNDLPRLGDNTPTQEFKEPQQALIGDNRNDENLAVAQTHLAFIKFHNSVAAQLPAELQGVDRFERARELVVQHYQSIVLHDFLPRIIEDVVLDDVLINGSKHYQIAEGEQPFMPVEFAVAAYRLGHSMIRDAYEWNRVFDSVPGVGAGPVGTLQLLFEFSGVNGNFNENPTLPSNWIIDWTRFYDFTEHNGVDNHPRSNKTRLIDTHLANMLQTIPEFMREGAMGAPSLAVRNLHRGHMLGLPTGQSVAEQMDIPIVASDKIAKGPHEGPLRKNNLHQNTPLWYYILKEAEIKHDGERLGTVGSRIIAETFVELIRHSRVSILREEAWKPTLPSLHANRFLMTDLLLFVNELNPIG